MTALLAVIFSECRLFLTCVHAGMLSRYSILGDRGHLIEKPRSAIMYEFQRIVEQTVYFRLHTSLSM